MSHLCQVYVRCMCMSGVCQLSSPHMYVRCMSGVSMSRMLDVCQVYVRCIYVF